MSPSILLTVLAVLPLVLAIVLRVKPLYFFVSVITGYFWVEYLGDSAELTIRSLVSVPHPEVTIRLLLFLLPIVLTFVLMRKTLSAASLPFQFFLLVGDSLLLTSFLLPILTPATQSTIYATHTGSIFHQAHDVAIAGIAALHLLVMFVMRPKPHDAHRRGHHGKKHH